MSETSSVENQSSFYDIVSRGLEPLLKRYGLIVTRIESHFIRFESEATFVTISYGYTSREIRAEIGLLEELYDGQERPYNLGEVVRLSDPTKDRQYAFFQSSTLEGLRNSVVKITQILELYGAPALRGNAETFHALSALRKEESADYMLRMAVSQAREQAVEAWNKKDYRRFVELMAPFRNNLKKSEVMKLELAQRKSGE